MYIEDGLYFASEPGPLEIAVHCGLTLEFVEGGKNLITAHCLFCRDEQR